MKRRPLSVEGLCRCGEQLVVVAGVSVCVMHCDVMPHPPFDPSKGCRQCARIGLSPSPEVTP